MTDIQTETITLTVSDGTTLPAYIARPAGDGAHPGLIVLQEAFGVNAHIRDVTERFARAGYTAIAPALFHRTDLHFEGSYTDFAAAMPHIQALTDDGQGADIRAAYDWLKSESGGHAGAVGSIGYCMGGRASFLADSLLPLQASVSYYGGGITGSPYPMFPDLLSRAPELHAPILLFWGGKDDHIGSDTVRAVEDALKAAGKPYAQVVFSQADHGFFCDARASYDPEAAAQAWPLTLAFLSQHLGPELHKTKLGIIGCGNISGIYFESGQRFQNIEVVACADMVLERAQAKAAQFDVPKALTVDQLLADSDVEIVINLTIPKAHADVALAALESGKHVYGEKPFTINRAQGRQVLDLARQKGLRVGCAPDTFLGAAHQTCRKLIDDGVIGEPVAATGFMMGHGHESWHPDPAFYYAAEGGGPLLDMGPYYLTALVNMIGGIRRVTGSARASFAERTVTSEPKRGDVIEVGTPTHISGTLDFANGAIGTLITSFDVWSHTLPNLEVHGREGSLQAPDPNNFGGAVKVRRMGETEWRDVPLTHGFAENSRGVGVADMAAAIAEGRPHRASGDLAYHVLDTMLGILDASETGAHLTLTSGVDRPAALPLGLPDDAVR